MKNTPKCSKRIKADLSFWDQCGRHFVSVNWVDYSQSDLTDLRCFVCLAVVIALPDHWVLLTKGSILNQVKSRLDSGRHIESFRIMDCKSVPDSETFPPIAFPLSWKYEPESDCGIITLDENTSEQLKAVSSVAPITATMAERYLDACSFI